MRWWWQNERQSMTTKLREISFLSKMSRVVEWFVEFEFLLLSVIYFVFPKVSSIWFSRIFHLTFPFQPFSDFSRFFKSASHGIIISSLSKSLEFFVSLGKWVGDFICIILFKNLILLKEFFLSFLFFYSMLKNSEKNCLPIKFLWKLFTHFDSKINSRGRYQEVYRIWLFHIHLHFSKPENPKLLIPSIPIILQVTRAYFQLW